MARGPPQPDSPKQTWVLRSRWELLGQQGTTVRKCPGLGANRWQETPSPPRCPCCHKPLQNSWGDWHRVPDSWERHSTHANRNRPRSFQTPTQGSNVAPCGMPLLKGLGVQEAPPLPPQACSSRRQTTSGYSLWVSPGCQVSCCRTPSLSHSWREMGPEPPNPCPLSSWWQVSPGRW